MEEKLLKCKRMFEKTFNYFFHVIYLESCYSYNVVPEGLKLNKKPFISLPFYKMMIWKETLQETESSLLKHLLEGVTDKYIEMEN